MLDNGKTLIQQAPGFDQSPESIAATALEKILSRSPSARVGLAHVVEQQSGRINPIMSVKTEEADGYPRDLVAVDAQGAAQVILVPLFDAKIPYLHGGLNHCFDRLTDDGNSTLLFVVPEERKWTVWRDMANRVRSAGKRLPGDSWSTLSATVDGSRKRLMLDTWSGLLNTIEHQASADPSVRSAVQELREFTGFMNTARQLVDGAKNQGVAEGWAVTRRSDSGPQELIRVRFHYGYGRYVRFNGMLRESWFGVNWQLWGKYPDTLPLAVWPVGKEQQAMLGGGRLPLEVYTDREGHWIPVHLNPAAGYDDNLPEVVRQLRAIALSVRVAATTA